MLHTTAIRQLQFSDLYLGHPSLADRFSDARSTDVIPLPESAQLRHEVEQLTQACRNTLRSMSIPSSEFKLDHDQDTYRVSVMPTNKGEMFVVRKIAQDIATLAELGVPQAYIRQLMARDMTGLFIVAGGPKAGKTTTASAMVKDRLSAYGGVAVTTEGPIELPLEGSHGDGICYQTVAGNDTRSFLDSFRQATRWGARMILIHEIRDPEVAAEVLQASNNGHLIISTMLASNVVRSVGKLHALVDKHLGGNSARALMADGLVGVMHQRLQGLGSIRRKLETEILLLRDAPASKRFLREGNFDQLAYEMRHQMSSLVEENAFAMRNARG